MAFTVTDSGVLETVGRGRGKTVALSVSFVELERWARRMKVDSSALFKRSYGRAMSGLRAQLRKVMRVAGGVYGVPKFRSFEQFTNELREKRNMTGRPMGGVLAEPGRIVGFKRNGWQVIGWPDSLGAWAVKFQDAEGPGTEFTDPAKRHYWHTLGIKDVPRAYVKNPRRVIPEPFGENVRDNLEKWAKDIYYKELAKLMKKGSAA